MSSIHPLQPSAIRKTWAFLVAAVAGLTLMAAGGCGQGGGGSAATADAMLYMPDDIHLFVVLQLDEATKSGAYKEMKALSKTAPALNQIPGGFDQLDLEKLGLSAENIQQVTLGLSAANLDPAQRKADVTLVMRTVKPLNVAEVEAKLKQEKFSAVQAGKFTIYENKEPQKESALCIVDKNTLVLAPSAAFLGKVLERSKKAKLGDNMQEAIKQMGTPKTLGIAVAMKDLLGKPEAQQGLQMAGEQASKLIGDVDLAILRIDMGADIDANLLILCKSPEAAKNLSDTVNGLLTIAKFAAGKNAPPEALELINALKITADGPRIQAVLPLKTAALVKLSKMAPSVK